MARKRQRATRRSGQKRRENWLKPRLGGLLVNLLLLAGLFQLGLVGSLVRGAFIMIGGGAAALLMGLTWLASFWLVISGHGPRLTWYQLVGGGLFLAGLLMFLHGQLFNQLGSHSHYLLTTGNRLSQVILNHDLSLNVGGGLLGGLLYSGAAYLVAPLGAWILAGLLMVVGVVIGFQLPWEHYLAWIGTGLKTVGRAFMTASVRLIAWVKTVKLPARPVPAVPAKVAPKAVEPPTPQPAAPVTAPKITVATQSHQAQGTSTSPAPNDSAATPAAKPSAPLVPTVDDTDYQLPPRACSLSSPRRTRTRTCRPLKRTRQR